MTDRNRLGIVVIARNEGERLKRCLTSLPRQATIIYVDSGSTDGSIEWAKAAGIDVVRLDTAQPFTAARARNAGFSRLQKLAPALPYVQFIDGDCELAVDWPNRATTFLDSNADVCAVFGRRRERYPERSVYNFLCDVEWDVPLGEARAFGGDVMLRSAAFGACDGYRNDLIAGEEPELALRLRAAGWTIMRLDAEMTMHDAAMTRFGQWWRRHQRSGFAFAAGADLHGRSPEKHWVWETRRSMLWGLLIPLVCAALTLATLPFGGWGALAWLIFPAQVLRLFMRSHIRPSRARTLTSVFYVLCRFPEAQGWITFKLQQWRGTRQSLIEYKDRAG
ncbi:glycosyltransferase family 2 protein [Tardiphaga robiniae]|uniref:Glycosyltransferase family 2 protein n=1 Tax=Tardiphaga robiniae TaxID=943830 RepID=A0A7G6TUJ7_9BRAD|nr:glycosyltransferase family 2 protein [Tardiphaga robiniae]QND70429.1 glycosyltransferase family 2 protein [Tardiphaga robiniae]